MKSPDQPESLEKRLEKLQASHERKKDRSKSATRYEVTDHTPEQRRQKSHKRGSTKSKQSFNLSMLEQLEASIDEALGDQSSGSGRKF